MKANPGGQIDPKGVIGRDEIIEQIWDTIEHQSICMNAERRIGKTTIIKKLLAEPRSGWIPIYQDLEKIETALGFAEAVYIDVDQYLSTRKRTVRRAREFLESIGGTEIGGKLKLPKFERNAPWREILSKSIEDLVEAREKHGERPLFLWDEVPYMLDKIGKREGKNVAMDVLDVLRSLRQEEDTQGLRMILTGSIGIHHVIHSLKSQGHASSPLNDTYPLEVFPLTTEFAEELVGQLLTGEKINTQNPAGVAYAIADISDCFPFYIQHIVKALKMKLAMQQVTPDMVESIVNEQLLNDHDPWDMRHFRTRILEYYGKVDEITVLSILDSVAVRENPVSVSDLLSELKNLGKPVELEHLRDILKLLSQDHYLTRNDQGNYHFKFPLIKRWWKLDREL